MIITGVVVVMLAARVVCQDGFYAVGTAILAAPMCNGTSRVFGTFETGKSPEDENQYDVQIEGSFTTLSIIKMELDDDATVTLKDRSYARISVTFENHFYISFYREHSGISFVVKGATEGRIPYFNSIKINGQEICRHPLKGDFDNYLEGHQDAATTSRRNNTLVNEDRNTCGQRKVDHTELIVNGVPTKPGDWPWHVAIYRLEKSSLKYICGGTLVSNVFVLTAAHCVTIRGEKVVPEILSVVLGKYNLIGGDIGSEERRVHKIVVHSQFDRQYLDNDIALLKLRSEVTFNDYIQPACLWKQETSSALPPGIVYGTVVGWGFDQTDKLAAQLQTAVMPILQDITCVRINPVFYGKILNGKKFCAGYQNGTSPCNGDSGGGFMVLVPNPSKSKGSWHVRGIISLTVSRTDVSLCDPQQNAVFTDTALYKDWINQNMIDNK